MKLPEMKPVESSKIKAIGYDSTTEALFVQFKSDSSIWRYHKVTIDEYMELLKAESVGALHGKIARNAKKVDRMYKKPGLGPHGTLAEGEVDDDEWHY